MLEDLGRLIDPSQPELLCASCLHVLGCSIPERDQRDIEKLLERRNHLTLYFPGSISAIDY